MTDGAGFVLVNLERSQSDVSSLPFFAQWRRVPTEKVVCVNYFKSCSKESEDYHYL